MFPTFTGFFSTYIPRAYGNVDQMANQDLENQAKV